MEEIKTNDTIIVVKQAGITGGIDASAMTNDWKAIQRKSDPIMAVLIKSVRQEFCDLKKETETTKNVDLLLYFEEFNKTFVKIFGNERKIFQIDLPKLKDIVNPIISKNDDKKGKKEKVQKIKWVSPEDKKKGIQITKTEKSEKEKKLDIITKNLCLEQIQSDIGYMTIDGIIPSKLPDTTINFSISRIFYIIYWATNIYSKISENNTESQVFNIIDCIISLSRMKKYVAEELHLDIMYEETTIRQEFVNMIDDL